MVSEPRIPNAEFSAGRTLTLLCAISAGWAFGFGLEAPLCSLWLDRAGLGTTLVGLNTSVYYLGIALTAAAVPALMRRFGRAATGCGLAASGLAVALFPWSDAPLVWFVLRGLNGVAGAVVLIPLESQINHNAPPHRRAFDFGCYAVSVALGIALGTAIGLHLFPAAPRLSFLLGGAASLLVVPLVWRLPPLPAPDAVPARSDAGHLRRRWLSFGSAWAQGFLEAGMMALLPLHLLAVGTTVEGTGSLLAGILVGVIVLQVPIAWLADRLGRAQVLVGCYGVVAGALAAAPWSAGGWLWAELFLAGACSGAFYPLGLALLGERLSPSAVAGANAWFLAVNCVGSLVSPVLTGAVMEQCGTAAIFFVGEAVVLLVLAACALQRIRRGGAADGAGAPDEPRAAA